MDRASDYGSEGWGFESLQAHSVWRQNWTARFGGPFCFAEKSRKSSRSDRGASTVVGLSHREQLGVVHRVAPAISRLVLCGLSRGDAADALAPAVAPTP